MKKLLFIYGPLGGGGAERVLLDLLHNLDYSKYEVDLCLIVNQGILLPEVPHQVTVISLWETYTNYYKIAFRLSIWFGNNLLFKRILKEKLTKKYDVEVSFLEGMPLKLHAIHNSEAKKITWVHCDLFNFPYEAKLFAKNEGLQAYNKMDAVITVSNDALLAFEKRFPTCRVSKKVIYNPIDSEKITALTNEFQLPKNKHFTIAVVGRLTMPKKIDRAIRLLARLKSENYKVNLRIIGDGELKNELVNLANHLHVTDEIDWVGFVKNPFPHIKNADLLLLPSAFEGFGLVVCEAMLLGVPVVATKTAGPTEIIENDQYGLLCNHDDDSIYKAVKKMIDDENLRSQYKIVGQQRARIFDVTTMIAAFEKVMQQIA